MRILFIILLFSLNANATVYYVSNTGSDIANGLTTGTAWQTIAKVNASSFNPGDQVLFKAGDSWNERLNVPSSGSSGNVITFGSYGTGAKPLITGFQSVTGFTNVGNVWTATATNSVKKLNTVLIGEQLKAKGRYPNSTYLTLSSFSGDPITQITGGLTGTPNYTGGEIGVRSSHFTFDVANITSQSGGVLNFSPGLTYGDTYGGDGYFIQNIESVLDVAGEWAYDSTTKVLKVYSTTSPTVQISTIDTLVHLDNHDYITFDGLSFTGANKAVFQIDTSNHVTITNCSINYSGAMGISALKSDYTTISNDSIQNSFSNAIFMRQPDPYTPTIGTCNNATITGNYIKNSGTTVGMGMNQQHRYMGICVVGHNAEISYNRLDSIGYNGIMFNGQNSLVYANYITNYCFALDDGAGIMINIGSYFPLDFNDDAAIRKNIVGISTGASPGTNTVSFASGIYLDQLTKQVTVDSNTAFNTPTSALFIHLADSNTVTNNTLVNDIGNCFDLWGVNAETFNMNIKHNIFYSQSASYYVFKRDYGTLIGQMDSNYFSRPLNESNIFYLNGATYSLAGWQAATGFDAASTGTPSGITSDTPLFHYNPTLTDSVISLSGQYKDIKGTVYTNSITLSPFTSAVLYKMAAPVSLRVKIRRVQNI